MDILSVEGKLLGNAELRMSWERLFPASVELDGLQARQAKATGKALQLKLDELICAAKAARNGLVDLKHSTHEELRAQLEAFKQCPEPSYSEDDRPV